MKKLLQLSVFVLLSQVCFAQVHLFLKPNANDGKDAFLASVDPGGNYGNHPEFAGEAWTCGGNPCFGRCLIQFDLSSIPQGALITSATMNLFANTSPSNGNGIAMQGTNSATLRRITSTWDESTVTWLSEPSSTYQNAVTLSTSTQQFQDYGNIDVTALVQDMANNPSSSYGFELALDNETPYATMIFASSDFSDSTYWPELIIDYIPQNCYQYAEFNSLEDDAYLADGQPTTNYSNHPELASMAWTCGGNPCIGRGLFKFDLSMIPTNAVISSASLDLYANPAPVNGNGIAMQGANESVLQRVTSSWSGINVTFNTSPATTGVNEVVLPQSSSASQDYLGIDVTSLVTDMVVNPSSSFGFLLKLQNETPFTSMIFASADYPDTTLHPHLSVCYSIPNAIDELNPADQSILVSPNPIANQDLNFTIALVKQENLIISLMDYQGKLVKVIQYPHTAAGLNQIYLNDFFANLSSSAYILKVSTKTKESFAKIIKQ